MFCAVTVNSAGPGSRIHPGPVPADEKPEIPGKPQ